MALQISLKPVMLICGLALMLAQPAWSDLAKAQDLFDRGFNGDARREAARCHREDPDRAELLEIWALHRDLREGEAVARFEKFRPKAHCMRLYLLVHSALIAADAPSKRRDLEQALELSKNPAEQVDVLLRLFRATEAPDDRIYWLRAAEIAGQHPLDDSLLLRLSQTHVSMLKSQGRISEAWYDLSYMQGRLGHSLDRQAECLMTKAQILDGLGKVQEAEECRWRSIRLNPEPLSKMKLMKSLSDNRSSFNKIKASKLLKELDLIEPHLSDPRHRLYAFRLRSIVCQETKVGLEEWLKIADRLERDPDPQVSLLAVSERALVYLRTFHPQAQAEMEKALRASLKHPPYPDDLFLNARPAALAISLAYLELARGQFKEAESHTLQVRELCNGPSDQVFRGLANQALLQLYLQTGRLEQARSAIHSMLADAEKQEVPVLKAVGYLTIFTSLMSSNMTTTSNLVTHPTRINRDTPAGWLFEEIRNDPILLSKLFKGLDDWGKSSTSPVVQGNQALFRGIFLACLDRPLEAIDAFTQGIEAAKGEPMVQATIGRLLSRELFGQGRRNEALEAARVANDRVRNGSAFAQPGSYRIALLAFLLEQHQDQEAARLSALPPVDPMDADITKLLHARATHQPAEMKQVLESKDKALRKEALFQLCEWEPQAGWDKQVTARDLKTTLRLVQLLLKQQQTQQALQVCEEGLEEFHQKIQQLPVQTQPRAAQSPSFQALVELAVKLGLQLNRQEVGARWMSRWHAFQQAAPTSPELETLRAELTGLTESENPALQTKLADTRAQFLVALNQVRQLHPESETALSAQGSQLLAIQPHLDRGSLLVQYFVAPEAIYIQTVSKDSQKLFVVQVEKARLKQLLGRWLKALENPGTLKPEQLEASRQLYSLLISPLQDLRKDHPNLLMMPSGELWALPFETLQDESEHYLVETSSLTYLGPSDTFQLTQPTDRKSSSWLGLGNANLPGTEDELRQLSPLFPGAKLLRGQEASWKNLQAATNQIGVLHIATHSQARPEQPNDSFLELADGPLPLRRIYQLSLAPGSLVVLSSCSSAIGQEHADRDLVSLASGFRNAGASSVVASLWRIDDDATAKFFPPMYRSLLQGDSRAQSLRNAKLSMLKTPQHSHPFYWGAFTLLGDSR